ncbi:MAG: hypothetical protein HY328_04865 [Chloroflexi bacterium]|nr:hypothetical protein [Chloroflexota bacterium]
MQAIRQIAQVVGRRVTIDLPASFVAEQVEVIVLPAEEAVLPQTEPLAPAVQEFLALDTTAFSPQQRAAYERASTLLRRGRRPDEPRILGIFAGLVEVADNFDAPLEDEELWWGSETDEYGMSLPQ